MDHAASGTRTNVIAIPRQRMSAEQVQIRADDLLIEDLRAGRVTDISPVPHVIRLLARWRRTLLVLS
jgi:hypothetical protein